MHAKAFELPVSFSLDALLHTVGGSYSSDENHCVFDCPAILWYKICTIIIREQHFWGPGTTQKPSVLQDPQAIARYLTQEDAFNNE